MNNKTFGVSCCLREIKRKSDKKLRENIGSSNEAYYTPNPMQKSSTREKLLGSVSLNRNKQIYIVINPILSQATIKNKKSDVEILIRAKLLSREVSIK